ncbi:MAG: 16S rRNA (adenine(1518)-N(6)/adenine(1519)-N(6))-dimethyltransferase RsmA [Clostridia bacterium]|nr:16S rRNA (adenine(1518)-N(6)/adenine(1519)-N(6))-dimethyltransferase RsmA [Clostridia bacterium]
MKIDLTDISYIRGLMKSFDKSFSKSLGQNFLVNSGVLEEIACAAGITEDSYVLEIGPGIGTLTRVLADHAAKVVSVEIDDKLIPVLEYTLSDKDNVTVINNDILKTDIPALIAEHFEGKKVKLVANLPYYITTPIILELIKHRDCFSSLTVMVQKEVAERMAAKEGSKDFGSLSVHVQYYTNAEIQFIVPPDDFVPAPKVSSAVIRLDILENPSVTPADEKNFFRVVRGAFALRRKTLVNSLASAGFAKEQTFAALTEMGVDQNIRGEKLSLSQFAQLSDLLM